MNPCGDRTQSKFFRPIFPALLDSRWEDGRKVTLADLESDLGGWTLLGPRRATPEENVLELEAFELWKTGNRVFAYYLEDNRWVDRNAFVVITEHPAKKNEAP